MFEWFYFTPFACKRNDIIIIFGGLLITITLVLHSTSGQRVKINRWRDHYCNYNIYYSIVDTNTTNYNLPLWCSFDFEYRAYSTTHFIKLKWNENWFSVLRITCVSVCMFMSLICRRLLCINCATGQFDFN